MSPLKFIQAEPALFLGMIEALLALALGFGLDLTPEQFALIIAALTAVLAFVTRQRVTPIDKSTASTSSNMPTGKSTATTPSSTTPTDMSNHH